MIGARVGSGGTSLPLRAALLGVGVSALLAFVIVRTAVEDRSRLRGLAAQGCWFKPEPVGRGQTVTRELPWSPERDVYVVGWNPLLAAETDAGYEAELTLFDHPAKTRIFGMVQRRSPPAEASRWDPGELPEGTGYRVPAGRALTLRLRITNTGSRDFWTEGCGAQIRVVPGG
jgi:hypothetical protein